MDEIREGLMMLQDIPHATHFEVGTNLHGDTMSQAAPDLVVYAEFADQAALDAYKAHPIYAACVARVRPQRDMRIAADFHASPPRADQDFSYEKSPPLTVSTK